MMNESLSELLTTWDIPPLLTYALVLIAMIYVIGWTQVRRTRPDRLPPWRLLVFLGGILAIFVAVSSPLDTFSETLLFMHMVQHFVLMSIAPPLLVLGAPIVPLLRGLPRWIIRRVLRPVFQSEVVHSIARLLIRPSAAWFAMNAAYVGWHCPAAYEFALSSEGWHNLEHACFLFTSILFWWPIVQPWPFHEQVSRWAIVPYMLLADLVNTGVSAYMCFCGRLIYPSYGQIERPFGISALNDQIAAGAFMWVFGSIVFLIPVVAIIFQVFSSPASSPQTLKPPNVAVGHSQQLARTTERRFSSVN
jgi:putative membrane protein